MRSFFAFSQHSYMRLFIEHTSSLQRITFRCRAMSTSLGPRCEDSKHEDFFRYSGGRWLWDEDTQLQKRYKRFNVSELSKIAAKSVGSHACISIIKLAEGGFNKVFRLTMDDGAVAIARIPNPNAGPLFKITASEVATMDFARTILEIPVPRVLSWSGIVDNPVESEYILMEEAVGTQLGELWGEMDLDSKFKIVDDIVAIERKLLSASFTRYGNLYFAEDAFIGCEKAEILDGPLSQSQKIDIKSRFVIGPVASEDFWNEQRASLNIDRGPWESPENYLKAISEREIAWISSYAIPKSPHDLFANSEAQNSPSTHIALYRKFLDIADYVLPSDQDLIRSTLWHWDIHSPNLFVNGDKITSLIDWQDAWAGPLFLQARHPKLVDYNGEVMLSIPDHYKDVKDEEEKARIRTQVERSIVLWAYEAETKKVNPVLHEILHLPHGRTRRDTVQFAANTWDGDIIPFRQCLIRVARHWNEINSDIPCPITFTDEELKIHYQDGEGWNERADFWDSLKGFVHRDGWTLNDNYEEAFEMFADLRKKGLETLVGEERLEFEKQTRWAVRKDSE